MLLTGIKPPSNSFVLRQHKIVFIATTKVASTSLRWMMADLAGENFERFYRASGAHQSRYMTIHTNRGTWQHTPRLADLEQEELDEISPDKGWFVFAVVRDPWVRLWSAWQSKFLVQHTPYVRDYQDQPWFPREPTSPTDILDDWSAFVTAKPWETNEQLAGDKHFQPQVNSVRPGNINYTKVYDLSEMGALQADVHTHLQAVGLDKELYLPRANETPLPMAEHTLDSGIEDVINKAFAEDIAEWGNHWDVESIKRKMKPIDMDSVRAVQFQIATFARIGDMSKELKRAQQRIASLEAETTRPQHNAPSAQPVSGSTTPTGFAQLLQNYPWPSQPRYPDVEPAGRAVAGFDLVTEAIAKLDAEQPVVLEIGAELGGSTRLALAVPNTHVVSVDPWPKMHKFRAWPQLEKFVDVPGAAFDLFTSFNFPYRDRLVALRDSSPQGLVIAYEAGLRPDVVYIDGDHRTDAVLQDLTTAAALFPHAVLCGNDWSWKPQRNPSRYEGSEFPVRAAVERWAAFHALVIETRQNTWLLAASAESEARGRAAKRRRRGREIISGRGDSTAPQSPDEWS